MPDKCYVCISFPSQISGRSVRLQEKLYNFAKIFNPLSPLFGIHHVANLTQAKLYRLALSNVPSL